MISPERFNTHTLKTAAWGPAVCRVLAAAIEAVDPAEAIRRYLQRDGEILIVGEQRYDLRRLQRVRIAGMGKAGAPMTEAAAGILGPALTDGIVIVKQGYLGSKSQIGPVRLLEAGHPLPDTRSLQATSALTGLFHDSQPGDLVLTLISGGGSALFTQPGEGLELNDLTNLTRLLLASGADIKEINTLRKHLDQVKGGQLARLMAPARVASLILSDVVGDPLDAIASGPTVPDPSTFEQARAILEKYQLLDRVPESILRYLERGQRGELPETPKPGDPIFERTANQIIASNRQAAQAAAGQARLEGLRSEILTTGMTGEARLEGRKFAQRGCRQAGEGPRPACLIAGGETTVSLQRDGQGGRNQEFALAGVGELGGLENTALVSLATDGGDGPTDAAGAVVSGETLARAWQIGLEPDDYLARNDAYHFFDPLGDLLKPGPTQTNVNDLAFFFAF
jgi:glycerate 2-kinase